MKGLRNATCIECSKDFNYPYSGGPTWKRCTACKPRKRERKQQLNAHDFNWGPLPRSWRNARSTGNPVRRISRYYLTLFIRHECFSCSLAMMGNPHYRDSTILATEDNIPEALTWAEGRARNIVDSFETFESVSPPSSVG